MLELLLGFTTVTVTALGGALGTERTQADTTRLKSESRTLQATRKCRARTSHRSEYMLKQEGASS